MGVEIVCDVVGCESRAPAAGGMLGMPDGWSMIVVGRDEIEQKKFEQKIAAEDLDMLPLGPRGVMPKKVACCPKHELPKFKPGSSMSFDGRGIF